MRTAAGDSEFVLAVNIDIRGFSSFFSDSSQAAAFLSSAYTRILDDYFSDVSFFKPTGDGLLLVKEIDRDTLQDVLSNYVQSALRLECDFSSICSADPLINFATPERVGIGLARGTATRLSAGGKVLDFSGYPLNLASRLMDLARPGGVVFDSTLGADLLPADITDQFETHQVYVKGLADLKPMTAYLTADVRIPDANKKPIGAELYGSAPEQLKLSEVKKRGPIFLHRLEHVPSALDSVKLQATFPKAGRNGQRIEGVISHHTWEAIDVTETPSGLAARFNYGEINEALVKWKVKTTWPVVIQIIYSVPAGTTPKSPDDLL